MSQSLASTTPAIRNLSASDTGPHASSWLVLLLVLVMVGGRFVVLTADPPSNIGRDYISDEGWWAHNARQHAVFGRWIMDQHNAGLMWAPLYSGVLRIVYGVAGLGLWQTRMLSVVSGLLTCAAVYVFVYRRFDKRTALVATALLGTNFLWLSYNRTAFVESFQTLMITLLFFALAASRQSVWAVTAGVLYVLCVLAKLSAVTLCVPIAAFWCWQLLVADDEASSVSSRHRTFRSMLWFVAGIVVAALCVGCFLILPHREIVLAELQQAGRLRSHQKRFTGILTLGLTRGDHGIVASQFVVQNVLMLTGLVIAGIRTLVDGSRSTNTVTRLCWSWFVCGLIMIGVSAHFDAHRRYLPLLPPMCILLAVELSGPGLAFVSKVDFLSSRRRWLWFACVGIVAVAVGFMGRVELAQYIATAAREGVLVGRIPSSSTFAAAMAWLVISSGVALLLLPLRHRLPSNRVTIPAVYVLTAIIGLNMAKAGAYFSNLHFDLSNAAATFQEIGEKLPPEARIVMGGSADTLALGSDFFTFVIRRWDHSGVYMNLDGWERYHPNIVIGKECPVGFERVADVRLFAGNRLYVAWHESIFVRTEFTDAVLGP